MSRVLASFMAAVSLLKHEIEDSTEEVAALAETGLNAWIDADWAASFFEMALVPESVPAALKDAELIAGKIYLSESQGITLHVVWFAQTSSLYCVLAAQGEDLPLLDVAFPDVTARNRAVQVRSYDDTAAKKLVDRILGGSDKGKQMRQQSKAGSEKAGESFRSYPVPFPRALRLWEGRRRGISGVGYGAAEAMRDAGASAADAIRQRAALRAETDAKQAAESEKQAQRLREQKDKDAADKAVAAAAASAAAAEAERKRQEAEAERRAKEAADKEREEKWQTGIQRVAGAEGPSASGGHGMPSILINNVARAPHHIAPMQRPGGPGGLLALNSSRLALPGASGNGEGKTDEEIATAPWDASGRPKGL
jgi:hypothetical protein